MKICIVLSTRPEIIKLSSLIKILKEKKINFSLINTNQHYLKIMSNVFFKFFNFPKPKYNVMAPTDNYKVFFSKAIWKIEKILNKEKPNYLIIQGDTNTALSGCFAATIFNQKKINKLNKINIVHIESGLRSFNEKMPEEVNRKIIDQLSNTLFVPTTYDLNNLKNEKIINNKNVYKVGNTISDIIKSKKPLVKKNKILKKLKIKKKEYFLTTLHRPESIDNLKNCKKLIFYFEKIGKKFNKKIIFPVHPRTEKIIKKLNINNLKFIKFIKPLEFLDFLNLMNNCSIVLTDSGGIQEETSLLGIPCVTIRTKTERQITVKMGTNIVTGYNYKKISNAISFFENKKLKPSKVFGNGNVAKEIFKNLKKIKNKKIRKQKISNYTVSFLYKHKLNKFFHFI